MRNFLLPFLTSVLSLSLLVFVSCAHNETSEDASGEETADSSSEEWQPSEGAESSETAEASASESSSGESDLTASIEGEGSGSPEEAILDGGSESSEGDKKPAGEEPMSDLGGPPPDLSDATAAATDEPPADIPPLPTDVSSSMDEGGSSAGLASVNSSTPRIPGSAFTKAGALLNRFYFLRQGDTASSLGQLLLGASGGGSNLKKWNSGSWKAGRIVYYTSNSDPSDNKMRPFYQERGVPSEAYTIGRGDWLSKIAQKNYGSLRSWREIAVLNGIRNPDAIEPGMKINLYPADLSGYSIGTSVGSQGVQPDVVSDISGSKEVGANAVPETVPPPPATESVDQPPPKAAQIPPSSGEDGEQHSFELSEVLSQNITFIAIGGAILLLLIALAALKRRRAAAEFGDDAQAPTRARRR